MTPDGVDYDGLGRLVESQIAGGVSGLVAVGTTGECPTLDAKEHIDVIKYVIKAAAGRVPVFAGTGSNCTREAVELTEESDKAGADGFLVVAPYYNKPSQEGLYQHFRTVSEHSPLPVILYNIPGRAGVNMTAETTLRLAREVPNIIGIKEASGNIEQIQQIIDHRPEGFLVLSGDDALTIELMRRGGDGVISVAANAFPQRFMQCVHLAEKGDFEAAGREYAALDEAVQALFEEGNPVGVKCALSVMGKIGPTMRLPLVEGTAALREKFRRLIAEYDLR